MGCPASPREPGRSLAVLPHGGHEGCPLAALGSLLAAFAPGGCTSREQPGQLQSSLDTRQLLGHAQVLPAADPSPAQMLSSQH